MEMSLEGAALVRLAMAGRGVEGMMKLPMASMDLPIVLPVAWSTSVARK